MQNMRKPKFMSYDNFLIIFGIGGLTFTIIMSAVDYYATVGLTGSGLPVFSIKYVPCEDNSGREFIGEMCKEKIYCSKLGLIGEKRCKT